MTEAPHLPGRAVPGPPVPPGVDPSKPSPARLHVAALAPGSYLALSHATPDRLPPIAVHAMVETYANATEQLILRPRAEVERFFAGMEIVPPHWGATDGLTFVGQWERWIRPRPTATGRGCCTAGWRSAGETRGSGWPARQGGREVR